jgi:hypothetical protein
VDDTMDSKTKEVVSHFLLALKEITITFSNEILGIFDDPQSFLEFLNNSFRRTTYLNDFRRFHSLIYRFQSFFP